ncbi:carbohydrate ABC transporter permease [Paenibacillus cymbidii]|uniref:carbohydrate ABC transporter permease n=1 Tax=Paenibacillus cymbidii TaxID=1639034 RepID=UPI0010802328|nr:carbohydrate ABC transporter permease [Paenibacillus cymbidii]
MRLSAGEKWFQACNYSFLLVLSLLTLLPLWEVVRISLSEPAEASRMTLSFWPSSPSFDAYRHVLRNPIIWSGYANTLLRMTIGVALQLVLTVLTAYALSRKRLPLRGTFTAIIVFTMFFSGGLIPDYLLVQEVLHIGNTPWALVLPPAINTFSMLIVRNYFQSIPTDLEQSATIDGAGDVRILAAIFVPLSLPIIVTVALWGLVWHWNAWFDALVYIRDTSHYPLQLVLRKIVIESSPAFDNIAASNLSVAVNAETIKAATVVAGTAPIVVLYPFAQKYFVQGVMVGSLKG